MDKNALKKYAVWARRELITRVSQRAAFYGVTEEGYGNVYADSINGRILSDTEKKQRQALIAQIQKKGYGEVMEEAAYTWFNRFLALRFMEVNGYLPTHVRIFTDDNNQFKPQILTEAINLDLDGLDIEKVYAYKDTNQTEELFKYLLITQCNALNAVLPKMFQKIEDYTELLLPDKLLREGSIIEQMIEMIPENNFNVNSDNGQVEVIGWLYQYYISEKHEEVIDPLHGKVVSKDEIPAATQLFTTDWVVRYLIDNSVGRYWIERNPSSVIANELNFLVKPEAEKFEVVDEKIVPQDINVFDPCVGSGHFLVYAFDVLMKIYIEYGYTAKEAVKEIVNKNLYGVDIDGRAAQLSYFAIMMKGCQYDSRFLKRSVQPNIYEILESNFLDDASVDFFCGDDNELKRAVKTIIETMVDVKEYGSIIKIPPVNFDKIFLRLHEIKNEITVFNAYLLGEFRNMVCVAYILSMKYAVVITNPPYLNKYDTKLKQYIVNEYRDYKGDLFSVFIYRNFMLCKKNGYSGFMTPFVWMFIRTYEKLREYIINSKAIITLVQMEYSAYEEATVPLCSFVLKNGLETSNGLYFRLSDFSGGMEVQKRKILEAIEDRKCGYVYETTIHHYESIPGKPLAYWISKHFVEIFQKPPISKYSISDGQTKTGDNNKYLRNIWEVDSRQLGRGKKWSLIAKGGDFRRWAGNVDTVIDWSETARYHYRSDHVARIAPEYIWFRKGVCWNHITSGSLFAARYIDENMLFETAAPAIFFEEDEMLYYVIGYLNSPVSGLALRFINPTISTNVGDITSQPLIIDDEKKSYIIKKVRENIDISLREWNAYEIALSFQQHPLISVISKEHDFMESIESINIARCYVMWEKNCIEQFNRLKVNEEELNRIFIDIYGLQDELTPEVEDKDVTVRKADLQRDIKSLISYGVGCMFGRYSLDKEGLIFAGGPMEDKFSYYGGTLADIQEHQLDGKYTFGELGSKFYYIPIEGKKALECWRVDADNIIPITDDEYFADDIVEKFIVFIRTVYGEKTLEENLKFIADALGGKGQPREVIRNYFLNDFYRDHCKIYQKRPIYWLFDSGKKNGFKCLIYMHRYEPDTIARIRTDYVHEQQSRYRTAIAQLEHRAANAGTSERVKLNKSLKKIQEQADELHAYEEKIHHLADQMIAIDLDDGVKHNYEIFKDVLAKIK